VDAEFLENWATQIRKGLLDLCVLNAVARQRVYGYDIVRMLRKVEGLVISEGTIYPLLSRLSRDGLVKSALEESSAGPARKYYELTAAGRRILQQMNASWANIVDGVGRIRASLFTEGDQDGNAH
jgi:PadR family transcriptional regulator PadR